MHTLEELTQIYDFENTLGTYVACLYFSVLLSHYFVF